MPLLRTGWWLVENEGSIPEGGRPGPRGMAPTRQWYQTDPPPHAHHRALRSNAGLQEPPELQWEA